MTSVRDDSSVDDNMSTSTIEDSAWDIIDEASVATSDDEDRNLSRQQTPSNDGLDRDHDNKEIADNGNNNRHGNGLQSSHSHASLDSTLEDLASKAHESWASETTKLETPRQPYIGRATEDNFAYHEQGGIKFDEPIEQHSSHAFEVSYFVKEFCGQERDRLCQTFNLGPPPLRLSGTLIQQMSPRLLNPGVSLKLLYIGSSIARQPIIQKLSTALACSLSTATSCLKPPSSRYSIVPISAFGGGSSPEVVLVDHMGLEIDVEDCLIAKYIREELGINAIVMNTTENRSVQSVWDGSSFALSGDYKLPDLAIICIPKNETALSSETRVLANHLLRRHDVPVLTICSADNLSRPDEVLRMHDRELPHFCLEGHYPDQTRQLKRLPIDLSSFLSVDALQMNRNLASVIRDVTQPEEGDLPDINCADSSATGHGALACLKGFVKSFFVWISPFSPSLLPCSLLLLLGLLLSSGALMGVHYTKPIFTLPENRTMMGSVWVGDVPGSTFTLASPPTSASKLSVVSVKAYTIEQVSTGNISPHTATDLTSLLLNSSSLAPNASDRFKLHIIGDCHVILRPPQWFNSLKKAPPLQFKISRQNGSVNYTVSTLFEGVFALKLPREEAHGPLNVSVWTTKKPKVNDTFQIDFGSPWLKVAGWKRATQLMTEQLREELRATQTGLSQAYMQTSTGLQALVQNTIQKAEVINREIEKYRMKVLDINEKATDSVVNQLKDLSSSITKSVLGNIMARSRFTPDALRIQDEINKVANKALQLRQRIVKYRETHLVESQKLSLRLWWRIRGGPPRRQSKILGTEEKKKQKTGSKVT